MKKMVLKVLVLGLLGAWAVIAISSSTSPSHRCNEEWKIIFEKNTTGSAIVTPETGPESVVEMYQPGFRSLILF